MLVPFARTLILYLAIIIAIRMMGKRQVGEMQPTELVVTILISAVASVPMQDIDIPLMHGLVPILTLIAAEVLISTLSIRIPGFRKMLSGSAIPIVKDGEIDQKAAKQLRLSIDDIFEDLRLKDVFDLRTVKLAQVETNGKVSVLLNEQNQTVSAELLSLSPPSTGPFLTVITDGKLNRDNLSTLNLTEKWLHGILAQNKAADLREVFFLCADRHGNTIFARKEQ